MVLKRQEKVDLSQKYAEQIENIAGLLVFDYRGLTVAEVTELRNKIRATGANMKVVKNRMLARAVKERPYGQLAETLKGPSAVIFPGEDAISPAKALVEFAKTHDVIKIKGGMISDSYLDANQVVELSKIPSKEELYSKMLGGIKAPATNLLGLCKGAHQKIHGLLVAYEKKLGEAA